MKIKRPNQTEQYLNIANVILLVIKKDQCVEFISKTGCDILGFQQKEIIGKNWFDNFVVREHRNEERGLFAQMFSGTPAKFPNSHNLVVNKAGDNRLIEWQNKFLRDDSNNIIGSISLGKDITGATVLDADIPEKVFIKHTSEVEQEQYQKKILEAIIKDQQRERARLGQELHNNVSQMLATVKLYNEIVLEKIGTNEFLCKSIQYLQESINEIRRISKHLSAPQS